ncbi:hypothetical protein [Vulcanococcus limneticus]|uniref:hypothetical protein n=1 Tax=Vulcanococcus limneticus TaxID=2170428 RepID=UPI00398BD8FB
MTLSTQSLVLPVRQYYVQTDSQLPGQALRMCFSSTCAMAVKYLRPQALRGPNADDTYLRTVQRYGDTTSPEAQIAACADYGVTGSFRTDGTQDQLLEDLDQGFPAATGFLHHGPSSAPRGGGHWILAVGYRPGFGVFNDPYGELDNPNGGYVQVGSGGRAVAYSWRHWLPRWQVEGPASGWWMRFRPAPSVAPPVQPSDARLA